MTDYSSPVEADCRSVNNLLEAGCSIEYGLGIPVEQ
jgi:hypothetical protein